MESHQIVGKSFLLLLLLFDGTKNFVRRKSLSEVKWKVVARADESAHGPKMWVDCGKLIPTIIEKSSSSIHRLGYPQILTHR